MRPRYMPIPLLLRRRDGCYRHRSETRPLSITRQVPTHLGARAAYDSKSTAATARADRCPLPRLLPGSQVVRESPSGHGATLTARSGGDWRSRSVENKSPRIKTPRAKTQIFPGGGDGGVPSKFTEARPDGMAQSTHPPRCSLSRLHRKTRPSCKVSEETGGRIFASAYAVFLPYEVTARLVLISKSLICLVRPTGIEPVFPP